MQQVLLDWNGTVVADLPRALAAANTALRRLSIAPITGRTFSRSFTLPLSQFFQRLGVPSDALEEAEQIWNDSCIEQPAQLSRGARALLDACQRRQIPVGIITAADPALVGADSARLDIRHLLTWVAGRVTDKQAELTRAATTSRTAVYIGDTADDVEQARRAGVVAVALTGGYHNRTRLETAMPDLIIDDLQDIVPLLGNASSLVTD
jgi:phosphoglycolate phosphatase